ncbi:MAG TPA: glycosyltransferase family 39 protein [Gaiellaceae bacterium]
MTPRRLAPLAFVAAVAAAVRLPGVWTQAFWQDEVASARILAEPTLPQAIARVARTESTPPLWYVLGWALHHAGLPMREVRLLSVVAGAALAVATALLARRLVGERSAVTAGLLVALGAQFVAHGQEIRAYELFALVSVLFALALLAAVARPTRRNLMWLTAATAAGALTHYFFVFTAAAGVAWLVSDPSARGARARVGGALAAGAALTLPWLPEALRQVHQNRFWWIGPFRLRPVVATPLRLFTFAFSGTTLGLALSVATVVVVLAGVLAVRRSPSGRLVAMLALLPLVAAGVAWASGARIFALRNAIAIGPFVAVAVAAFPRRALAPVLAAALVLSLSVSDVGRVPPYDVMARALVADGWKPSIPIAVVGNPFRYRGPLEWYLPRRPVLALARARSTCSEVLLVTPSGRVVRVHGRLGRRVTLLGDASHMPHCARRLQVRHAALA